MLVSIIHVQGKPREIRPKEFNTKYLKKHSFNNDHLCYMCTGQGTYTERLPVCTSKVNLWINRSPKAQRLDGSVFSERESCWRGFLLPQILFHTIAFFHATPPVYQATDPLQPASSQPFMFRRTLRYFKRIWTRSCSRWRSCVTTQARKFLIGTAASKTAA